MMPETVTIIPPKKYPLGTWQCPKCGGMGTNCDGAFSIGAMADGSTEIRSRPASPCSLCGGKGIVLISQVPG